MVKLAHVVDAFTGNRVETINVSSFTGSRLLSARGDGDVTIPLDDSFTKAQLKSLLRPWRYIIVLERDGIVEYGGYITSEPRYQRGKSTVSVTLGDFWALLSRRVMTGRAATNIVAWQQAVNGTLGGIARWHLLESWNRAIVPSPKFPVTIEETSDTALVTRPYFGYEMKYLSDVFANLMAEGLDIYFQPRWASPGKFEWLMRSGVSWSSGAQREYDVTADESPVSAFDSQGDAARLANNAIRVGEGSEIDLLVRSDEDEASDLPLLERITMSKSVSDVGQLQSQATQDIYTYGLPTRQWSFSVSADDPGDVGDTAHMIFVDDPWMDDGIFPRRVVKVDVDLSEMKTITLQPTGGA